MNDRKWNKIIVSGFKTLYTTPEIFESVLKNYEDMIIDHEHCLKDISYLQTSQDLLITTDRDSDDAAFLELTDFPMGDRDFWTFDVDGLALDVSLSDVSIMLDYMTQEQDNGAFIKRGWWSVKGLDTTIMMTRGQYKALMKQITDDIPEIKKRLQEIADEQYDDQVRNQSERYAQMIERMHLLDGRRNTPLGGRWN